MTRIALIVNPVAGDGRCLTRLPEVQAILAQADVEVTHFLTERSGHAVELAKQAAEQGMGIVVSMGGDGTLNEVVNGLVNTPAVLGMIPAGSGNDFGRSFGLQSGDVVQACAAILRGKAAKIDLGYTEGKYFINVAGAGFDAEVGHLANVWGKKYFPGQMAYTASILRQLISFNPKLMRITLDDITMEKRVWLVAVANAKFFGGGMMIAPTAEVDDGMFDVYIIEETSKLELLRVLPKVFKGNHVSHPAVKCYRAKRVGLSSEAKLVTQADGEILGHLPREFRTFPAQLSILVP